MPLELAVVPDEDVVLLEVPKPLVPEVLDVEETPLELLLVPPNDEEPLLPELLPLEDLPEELVSPEDAPSSSESYSMSSLPTIALHPRTEATNTMPPTAPLQRGSMTDTL